MLSYTQMGIVVSIVAVWYIITVMWTYHINATAWAHPSTRPADFRAPTEAPRFAIMYLVVSDRDADYMASIIVASMSPEYATRVAASALVADARAVDALRYVGVPRSAIWQCSLLPDDIAAGVAGLAQRVHPTHIVVMSCATMINDTGEEAGATRQFVQTAALLISPPVLVCLDEMVYRGRTADAQIALETYSMAVVASRVRVNRPSPEELEVMQYSLAEETLIGAMRTTGHPVTFFASPQSSNVDTACSAEPPLILTPARVEHLVNVSITAVVMETSMHINEFEDVSLTATVFIDRSYVTGMSGRSWLRVLHNVLRIVAETDIVCTSHAVAALAQLVESPVTYVSPYGDVCVFDYAHFVWRLTSAATGCGIFNCQQLPNGQARAVSQFILDDILQN
jgi:hypothetical protein